MSEISAKLREQLECYLSLRKISPATKHMYKKAITEFLALLFERGRDFPVQDDYDDYSYDLFVRQGKSITNRENALRYVRKFFQWVEANPNYKCGDNRNITPPMEAPRKRRARRVSTLLSAYLYESLEFLAEQQCSDVSTVLKMIVTQYVAWYRKSAGDIESKSESKTPPAL